MDNYKQCFNEECEYCEDGFCMKDEYYAECPFDEQEDKQ